MFSKFLFSCLLLLSSISLFAQDTTYYNQQFQQVTAADAYAFYTVLQYDPKHKNYIIRKDFYPSGKQKTEVTYSNYYNNVKHGVYQEWHENGQLKLKGKYRYNQFEGDFVTYWDSGKIKRREYFKSGKPVRPHSYCYNQSGNKIEYFPYYAAAQFPGGEEALLKYFIDSKLSDNVRKTGYTGKIHLNFLVTEQGKITQIMIESEIPEEAAKLVTDVIKNMPDWKPAALDGEIIAELKYYPLVVGPY